MKCSPEEKNCIPAPSPTFKSFGRRLKTCRLLPRLRLRHGDEMASSMSVVGRAAAVAMPAIVSAAVAAAALGSPGPAVVPVACRA